MPPAGQKPQTFRKPATRKPADRNAAPRKAPGTDSRIQCFEVLRLVENGRHLDEALRQTRGLDDRDRRFVRLLAATCLRRAGQLDLILADLLDRPTSGRYELAGRDVSALRDDELSEMRLSHLGFIFQSFNLISQLTVEENIHLPLYYRGWEPHACRERAGELAERVGL